MNSIAHIRESDHRVQTVEEHLLGVKELAESFGTKIGVKHIAGLAGMLHDMGKYSDEFREYILEAVKNPEAPPRRGSVDHSTAGGRLLYDFFHTEKIDRYKGLLAEVVGNAIISHHSYLQDFLSPELESNYLQRVRDKCLPEFAWTKQNFFEHIMSEIDFQLYVDKAAAELKAYLENGSTASPETKFMFLTKFIFSTLIDADRTNTRLFEENNVDEAPQDWTNLFASYYDKLLTKINSFQDQIHSHSPINLLRCQMSEQCDHFAEKPPGIYTLSIPTGGGKTLASLRYALKHATIYRKKHIIYVVPYTTIIEQNAAEVRKILMDDANILEHHSNVVEDTGDDDEEFDGLINVKEKLKLAKDNWDSPIIFTTMVQFLNVFYAKGSRNIRRLHNLTESVLIFDEVQKVPVSCVSLFNEALNFLRDFGRSDIVLCTATQPALDFVEHKLKINADAEMISNLDHVIKAFKRVEVIDQATGTGMNNDELCDFINAKIQEVRSVLVILNTKSVVKKLYQQLKAAVTEIPVFHLSTSMCPAHRIDLLQEIREHLKNNDKIICVSTQLIEAGVDVSFECVVRSLAGLDSIAQAAGRCNRHGEQELQQVYVIDHIEENLRHLREIKIGKEISKRILIDLRHDRNSHGGHILSAQAMDKYFKEFYFKFKEELDYPIPQLGPKMTQLLTANVVDNSYFQAYCHKNKDRLPLFLANSYRTAAEHFHVIENLTTTVIVPYKEEGKDIIAELNGDSKIEDLTRVLRRAQQYTINLFKYELDQLDRNGGVESCLDGKVLVLNEGAYSDEFGLDLDNDSGFDLSIY
ncbi:CRISPR-associated helicase Cas3' [Paenibacillus sp. M1]|uniref:CRISPR-associated helicase Cas3 n=1 Tax=Paenibacillus haidiansis TaxID=1574488 RepID=A0ABU7VVC8_9BACL